jgi:hypothetical protein
MPFAGGISVAASLDPQSQASVRTSCRSRAVEWTLFVFSTLAITAALTTVEALHYSQRFRWDQLGLTVADRVLLCGMLASKTLWLLLVPLAVAGLLLHLRLRRVAAALIGVACFVVGAALFVDLRLVSVTGTGLTDYAYFLADERPLEMLGGQSVLPLIETLGWVGAAVIVILLATRYVGRWLAASGSAPRRGAIACAVYAAVLLVPCFAAPAITRPLVLSWHLHALPIASPLRLTGSAQGGIGEDAFIGILNSELARSFPRHGRQLTVARSLAPPVPLPALETLPDIVLVVVESCRDDALDPRWMPRIHGWSERYALRLARHYSAANASHTGLFALLYGRSPVVYRPYIEGRVPSQLCHDLGAAGYETILVSSSHFKWQEMDVFLSELNFDHAHFDREGSWPERDRRTLARAAELLQETERPPRLIMLFLMSSHFDYQYPPEYERHSPTAPPGATSFLDLWKVRSPTPEFLTAWRNRYRNSLAFLDDAVADFLDSIDLDRTVIALTGDHGESFYDDERWLHTGRLSEAQTRVPFLLAGRDVIPGRRTDVTSHVDVAPSLLRHLGAEPSPHRFHGRAHLFGPGLQGPDWVLLVDPLQQHVALLWGGHRLHLWLAPDRSNAGSLGFLDESGHFMPPVSWRATEEDWLGLVREVLAELGR